MTQAQLNRAVASATRESVQTIERLGFSFVCRPARGGRAKRTQRRHRRSRNRAEHLRHDDTMLVPEAV